MPPTPQQRYHPIIYVRGFAATQGEIEETVADPYMGFNIGSTKARMAWTGDVKRFFFESPLVRLMSDHDYDDVFVDGEDLVATERARPRDPVPQRHHLPLLRRGQRGLRHGRDAADRALREGSGQADPAAARQGLRRTRQQRA